MKGFKALYTLFNSELEPKTREEKQQLKKGFTKTAAYATENWFIVDADKKKQLESEIRECIVLLELMLEYYGLDVGFYVIMAIYVERYVKIAGKLEIGLTFDIFLTAAISTIKMWKDVTLKNRECAKLFDVNARLICENEIDFLTEVNYDLVVEPFQIEEFTSRVLPQDKPKTTSPNILRVTRRPVLTSSHNMPEPPPEVHTSNNFTSKCSKIFKSSIFCTSLLIKDKVWVAS